MTVTVTVPSTMSYDGTEHIYTDDSDPITGLDGGGHVERFTPAIKDVVSVASYVVTQGTVVTDNVTLSSQWANLTTGLVDTIDYSSKAWATGGTGVDTIGGSAKDWATKLTTVGNTSLFGAKKYANDANASAVLAEAAVESIGTIGAATGLQTTGASVITVTASPPTAGQILKATDPTHAVWGDSGVSNIVTATTDTTLTSVGTLLKITPTGYGVKVKLPDATTCALGGVLHIIDNKSPYPVMVTNNAGLLLGFIFGGVVSHISLSDKSTSAGVWTIENNELVGISAQITGLTTLSSVQQVIAIDADRDFLLCLDTSNYPCGIIYNKTTNSFGALTTIRAASVNPGVTKCVLSAANQVLVISVPSTGVAFEAVTLTLSGTSITVNTAATATLSANISAFADGCGLIAVDSSFVTSYTVVTPAAQIRALSISGTTVTIGAATVLGGVTAGLITNANNTGVIALSWTTTNLYTMYYGVSGSTLTTGTGVTTTTSGGNYNSSGMKLTPLGTRWAMIIFDNTNGTRGGIISLSGTTVTVSFAVLAAGSSSYPSDAIIVNGKILSTSSIFTANCNILSDSSGTAIAGTAVSLDTNNSVSCLYVNGTDVFVASDNGTIDTLSKLDCSGASPIVISSQVIGVYGVTQYSSALYSNASNSMLGTAPRVVTGENFISSAPSATTSHTVFGNTTIKNGTIKIEFKKSFFYGSPVVGKNKSERWLYKSALGISKMECVV